MKAPTSKQLKVVATIALEAEAFARVPGLLRLARESCIDLRKNLANDLNEALERIDTDRHPENGDPPESLEYEQQAKLARQCAIDGFAQTMQVESALDMIERELGLKAGAA